MASSGKQIHHLFQSPLITSLFSALLMDDALAPLLSSSSTFIISILFISIYLYVYIYMLLVIYPTSITFSHLLICSMDIVVKPMEEIVSCPKGSGGGGGGSSERKIRPQKEQALNCPRCNSTNTKFCYYNNYSLTQPRYFCKTCRRYWTEGGSLRNIPVGGGSRKNKRSSSSSSSNSSSSHSNSSPLSKKLPDLVQNPNKPTQDLNLGFAIPHHHDFKFQVPAFDGKHLNPTSSPSSPPPQHHLSSLELLTGLTNSSRGLSSFMPLYESSSGSGFPLPEFKPSLNFSLDGLGNSYGSFQGVQETNGKLLFPFEDLKLVSNNADADQNRDQNGAGYWNGVIGGGGSW